MSFKDFKTNMETHKIIMTTFFGSHLYGTDTEESDTDIKGVYFSTRDEILLGKINNQFSYKTNKDKNQKNNKLDIEVEMFSLHNFLKMAQEGQTNALDLLHAPANMIIQSSETWQRIYANRAKFYTKSTKAFIGYSNKQVAKYGVKGGRLNAALSVVNALSTLSDQNVKIGLDWIWGNLPINEHCNFIDPSPDGVRQYQVCGKILQETMRVEYACSIVQHYCSEYGKRAKEAANNKNVDWKAVSHAIRAALEVKELLTDNTITFPLKEAEMVLKVKKGQMNFLNEASPLLENLREEVEILAHNSLLPKKTNSKFWNNFLLEELYKEIL